MSTTPSHVVEITINEKNETFGDTRAHISISGDGGIEHMIESFKVALVAAGFALDTAKKLDELEL